jgi:hypothetical protein
VYSAAAARVTITPDLLAFLGNVARCTLQRFPADPKGKIGMNWRGSFEELEKYLRDFANLAGSVVPYHTPSVLRLLLALADNLQENAIEAELRDLVARAVSAEQAAFFRQLARLANRREGELQP